MMLQSYYPPGHRMPWLSSTLSRALGVPGAAPSARPRHAVGIPDPFPRTRLTSHSPFVTPTARRGRMQQPPLNLQDPFGKLLVLPFIAYLDVATYAGVLAVTIPNMARSGRTRHWYAAKVEPVMVGTDTGR